MVAFERHRWLWNAGAAAGMVSVFALYLNLRAGLSATPPTAGELLLAGAILALGGTLLLAWMDRHQSQKLQADLAARIASLREDPRHGVPDFLSADLGPLAAQLEALAVGYRKALADLAAQADALKERSQANARLQRINRDLERLKES